MSTIFIEEKNSKTWFECVNLEDAKYVSIFQLEKGCRTTFLISLNILFIWHFCILGVFLLMKEFFFQLFFGRYNCIKFENWDLHFQFFSNYKINAKITKYEIFVITIHGVYIKVFYLNLHPILSINV